MHRFPLISVSVLWQKLNPISCTKLSNILSEYADLLLLISKIQVFIPCRRQSRLVPEKQKDINKITKSIEVGYREVRVQREW